MKKYLLILILGISSMSTKAQFYFLGKGEKVIRDSMFKDDYKKFQGQLIGEFRYVVNYKFDELQDPLFQKKLDAAPNGILSLTDSITYSFTFEHDTCISSRVYHKCQITKRSFQI